jgi:hypothetical protein
MNSNTINQPSLQLNDQKLENIVDSELMAKFITHDIFKENNYGEFYDELNPNNDVLNLLNNREAKIGIETLLKEINTNGTISPQGDMLNTPSNIKIKLKPHQKRTLYEMTIRENGKYRFSDGCNINFLCDNVGSGKSLCVLSLIANSPLSHFAPQTYYDDSTKVGNNSSTYNSYSNYNYQKDFHLGNGYKINNGLCAADDAIELKTNLIIIPHNVFNQWMGYIKSQTNLTVFGISGKKDYTRMCKTKDSILNVCNNNQILLVKSTMYKPFIKLINKCLGYPSCDNDIYDLPEELKLKQSPKETLKTSSDKFTSCSNELRELMYKTSCKTHLEDDDKDHLFKKIEELRKTLKSIIDKTNWEDWNKINISKVSAVTRSNQIQNYYFQRVFVDEVDSIRIPSFPFAYAKQTWFITSSINNITYPKGKRVWDYDTSKYKVISTGIGGSGFLKEMIRHCFARFSSWSTKVSDYRPFFTIVRNNLNYVDFSMKIPEPIVEYIQCLTPPHLLAISSAIDSEALKALNAGDMEKAIAILGCNTASEEDLVEQVTHKLIKQRDGIEKKILEKESMLVDSQMELTLILEQLELVNSDIDEELYIDLKENKSSVKSHIKSIMSSIDNFTGQKVTLDGKIKGITDRVSNVNEKDCPVCKMTIEGPCITSCCNNAFCLECLTMAVSTSKNKECPLCRSSIDMNNLNIIVNECKEKETEVDENQLPTKMDKLLELVNDKSKRFMVFSEFDGGLSKIEKLFNQNEIRYSGIKGTSNTITKIIDEFKDKKFNVLLLNAKYFGAGLNLQFTDEIVIFHRMSKDLEKQVIGRAQRLGRQTPLNINYLCYENEY